MTMTETPQSTSSSADAKARTAAQLQRFRTALGRLRARVRAGILLEGLAIVALALALYFALTWPLDRFLRLETPVRAGLLLVLLATVAVLLYKRCLVPMRYELGDEELALAVERSNEELGQRLISALQFEERLARGALHGDSEPMMRRVLHELPEALDGVRVRSALRRERMARTSGYALLGVAVLALAAWQYDGFGLWAKRNLLLSSAEWPRATQLSVLGATNGEIVVPRGDDFTIEVRADGVVPESVRIRYSFDSGASGTDTMTQSVGESLFSYTFPGVLDPMRVEAWGGDGVTEELRVRLVDRPQLERQELRLVYPEYMAKEAAGVEDDATQVVVPRGTRVALRGRATKDLERAALRVGDEQRAPLQLDADGRSVSGEIAPEESGLLTVELLDRDGLSQGEGRSVMLRVVPDKAPILRTRLRGLGSMITQRARIPIELEAVDDFGLKTLRMVWQVGESAAVGSSIEQGGASRVSETGDFERFLVGSQTFEGLVSHDLQELVVDRENPDSEKNPVRPGLFVAVLFEATDNDLSGSEAGPDSADAQGKRTRSDSYTFKVVTEAELLRELNRRQGELRAQFEKIYNSEKADRAEFSELESPAADGELGARVRERLAKLSRRQRSLGKRVLETGRRYGDVLDEMLNNRVADSIGGEGRVRALKSAIVDRIEALGKSAMPALAGAISRYQRSRDADDRRPAQTGYDEAVRTMERILKEMRKLESFTEVLTQLKDLIRIEGKAADKTRKRLEADLKDIFKEDKD